MVQENEERPVRYTFRLANRDDLPRIVTFFQNQSRPKTVFERTEEAFASSIDNGLMWLLTDSAGNINTTGAVHILPVGMKIGTTVNNASRLRAMSLDVNFAEIGSVWRQGDAPAGFCLDLIYSACILQTYMKADELLISALVTQVVANNQKGIKKLLALKQGWDAFLLGDECTHQFHKTISDPECRTIELAAYYTPAGIAIGKAARCLLGLSKSNAKFSMASPQLPGIIEAVDVKSGKKVEIDLSATGLLSAAQKIVDRSRSSDFKNIVESPSTTWYAAQKLLQKARIPLSIRRTTKLDNIAPNVGGVGSHRTHIA